MSDETGLIQAEPSYQGGSSALVDLRSAAMSMDVDRMKAGLEEYMARRKVFREWLLDQLKPGIHFGYVPGTEPRFDDAGNLISKSWDKKTKGYKEFKISPDQWKAKPSLYKAGADFVCDLMGLRAEFVADEEGHRQLSAIQVKDYDGKAWPIVVYSCRLISRSTGEIVAEGRGSRRLNQKGGDENNTIKMCQKAAKVDAVLNAYGLSDLFTQDIEDRATEKHENPIANPEAPKAKPRGQRFDVARKNALQERFKAQFSHLGKPQCAERWVHFVTEASGRDFKPWKDANGKEHHGVFDGSQWDTELANQVEKKMEMEFDDG